MIYYQDSINNISDVDRTLDLPEHIKEALDSFKLNLGYSVFLMQGDASSKKYYRIVSTEGISYVLMDLHSEPIIAKQFVLISDFLIDQNLSAPRVYNYNSDCSLVLLEDLGQDSYTKILSMQKELEESLYRKAVEVLAYLAGANINISLPVYTAELLNFELESRFVDWYLKPKFLSNSKLDRAINELYEIFNSLYTQLNQCPVGIVLRDYHADNLMYLRNRKNIAQVGILDFQDAVIGSIAYDLVSLLEDVRRDINPVTIEIVKDYYFELLPQLNRKNFDAAYAILGLQRNLKILGLFYGLYSKQKEDRYKNYLLRVYRHIKNNLDHPATCDLKNWFKKYDISL